MERLPDNTDDSGWDLPDDPFERQRRVSEIADDLIRQFDKIAFDSFNRILQEIRAQKNLDNQD